MTNSAAKLSDWTSPDGHTRLLFGDCRTRLLELESDSLDSLLTDPPAGISFMGKNWDSNLGGREQWIDSMMSIFSECLRVLKHGAHGLVWAIPRTSHWTATALEDAGFEIRDVITHHFGCLSDDTEILVNGQWQSYKDLAVGDLVLGYNADRDQFTWEPIEEVLVYPDFNDSAYRLRGDHTDQLVTRDHRCLVEQGGSYVFKRAEDAAQELETRVPILEDVSALLNALPLPRPLTGTTEQDMLSAVCRPIGTPNNTDTTQARPSVPVVSTAVPSQEPKSASGSKVLLPNPCWTRTSRQPRVLRTDATRGRLGTHGLDGSKLQVLLDQDVWSPQSILERRDNVPALARQLSLGEVRSLPTGIPRHGQERWLGDGTSSTRGQSPSPLSGVLRGRTPHQPEPPRQPDFKPDAVRVESRPPTVRASQFTSSDLVRIEPEHYRGTVWCVRVPSGAFVARRTLFPLRNSGLYYNRCSDCLAIGKH